MSRRVLPAIVLVSFLVVPGMLASARRADPMTPEEEGTIREILRLEQRTKEAALHGDAAFSERMLADDYLAIGPLGNVITKSDTLAARRGAQLHYDSIDLTEMVVRVYGDTAVVMARAEVKGKDLGEDFSGPYRFTRVWVKRHGQWQIVSYQATVTQ
jgi:ketosteroid isomerase-like protein